VWEGQGSTERGLDFSGTEFSTGTVSAGLARWIVQEKKGGGTAMIPLTL